MSDVPAAGAAVLTRPYAKLCDPRDFEDPDVLEVLRSILPERDPAAFVERKAWEFAMLALFLRDTGRLSEDARVLAIGAGDERVLFWLANRVGRVVATDVYGTGAFAGQEGSASMLEDPAAHAPYPYREDRLEVRWADARALDFPDASFDAAFSLSSFEHFGTPREISRAARELGRVLRPGGHAFLAVDAFARRHPLNAAPVDFAIRVGTLGRRRRIATPRRRAMVSEVFTRGEVMRRLVRASGLELMQPLDLTPSDEAWENLTLTTGAGHLSPRTGRHWPHVLLQSGRSVFTSLGLPLRKPG